MTLEGWQARLTQTIAREIRRHRDRRKLSAQQLADRTEELGLAVPRNVVANLESGRRDTITAAEILIIAAALNVAPIELICPVGFDEQLELLPGRFVDPLMASRWVDGELVLDATKPQTVLRPPAVGEESSTWLAEQHAALLDRVEVQDAEVAQSATLLDLAVTSADMADAVAVTALKHDKNPEFAARMSAEADQHRKNASSARAEYQYKVTAAEQYREVAAQSLRFIRAEMRRRGMILPPLPEAFKNTTDGSDGDAL